MNGSATRWLQRGDRRLGHEPNTDRQNPFATSYPGGVRVTLCVKNSRHTDSSYHVLTDAGTVIDAPAKDLPA